jgi:mannose/fructose-specific phosphotransferase system component IIA
MDALVVTHGNLGQELIASAREVYRIEAPLEALSNSGRDVGALREAIAVWLQRREGPALILVDVGGGSCGIAAQQAAVGRAQTWVLGGVNLPMILTFLTGFGQLEPSALVSKMLDRGVTAVDLLGGAS